MIFNHPIQTLNPLEGNQNYLHNYPHRFQFIKDFPMIKIIVFIILLKFKVIFNQIIIITTILTMLIITIAIIITTLIIVTTTTIIISFIITNVIIHNINIIQDLLNQIQAYFMHFLLNKNLKKIKRKFS